MRSTTLRKILPALWAIAFAATAALAQPPETEESASDIVTQAIEARDALNSGRITYREILGTNVKTESKILVIFDENGIRTERVTTSAPPAAGAPPSESRQGTIRSGALWTQYSGGGPDPANWRIHSEVVDTSEESEATAANYDPRLFRTGTFPRTWAGRTRLRDLMSLPSILEAEPIVAASPTGDWLIAGKKKRPFEADIVFEVDERRAWSLVNIQVTRRVPSADGSLERWVHKAAFEPAQFGAFWFPGKYVWTKEVDGKIKQRNELVTVDAEFNIEIDPLEFTLRGIKGLPVGVKVVRNFEGSDSRTWNGSKLVEPGARP